MIRTEKHEFALYFKDLPLCRAEKSYFTIKDSEIVRRVYSVLRLKLNDSLVFFNGLQSAACTITAVRKKEFDCSVTAVHQIVAIQPQITVILPLLKREALEDAVYNAAAMGVSVIQLVSTEKSGHWSGSKELDRLYRVAIAAAEQSKQFELPQIIMPLALEKFLVENQKQELRFHADVEGIKATEMVSQCVGQQGFLLSVGPEGDLTGAERDLLRASGFMFVRLTPTILKAEQALNLLIGMLRSFT